MKEHWYIPQTGWDYFVTIGLSVNVVVSLILIVYYFTH